MHKIASSHGRTVPAQAPSALRTVLPFALHDCPTGPSVETSAVRAASRRRVLSRLCVAAAAVFALAKKASRVAAPRVVA